MTGDLEFSDEDLTAFLDGELAESVSNRIGDAIRSNPDLQARLDMLAVDTAGIARAFDGLLADSPPAPSLPEAELSRGLGILAPLTRPMLGLVMISIVIGWGGAHLFQTKRLDNWRDYVAAYQALYVNSTLAHIDGTSPNRQQELDRVSRAIGKGIKLSLVSELDQLDYKRAQILGYEGQPLIQLTFLSNTGDPVALCIIRSEAAPDSAVRLAELEGMSAAFWSKDGYEYLLIGGNDRAMIEKSAYSFSQRL